MHAFLWTLSLALLIQAAVIDPPLTSWSCTVETLLSGKDCVFEVKAVALADRATAAARNVETLRQLAPTACGRAVRQFDGRIRDPILLSICQRDFFAAAESCAVDGKVPLLDSQGRFALSARRCYRTLQEVLQRTELMAALSSGCCQCLISRQCSATGCYRQLAQGTPNQNELECMRQSCSDQCQDAVFGSSVLSSINTSRSRQR